MKGIVGFYIIGLQRTIVGFSNVPFKVPFQGEGSLKGSMRVS